MDDLFGRDGGGEAGDAGGEEGEGEEEGGEEGEEGHFVFDGRESWRVGRVFSLWFDE